VINWRETFPVFSPDGIRIALKRLPPDACRFIKLEVVPLIRAGQKIQAIKALREESLFGLKEAKDIVDVMQDGAPISDARFADPEVIDMVEEMEILCKKILRSPCDRKTETLILKTKRDLADMWNALVTERFMEEDEEGAVSRG
jgi:hypothetical protein